MSGNGSKQDPLSLSPTPSEPVLRAECDDGTEVASGPRTSSPPRDSSLDSKPVHPDCTRKPVTAVDRGDFVRYIGHIQRLSADLFGSGMSGDTGRRSCKTHLLDPLTRLGRRWDFANPTDVQVKDIQSIFNKGIDAGAPLPTETDWKCVLKFDGIQPGQESYNAVIRWVHWTRADFGELQPDLDPTLTADEKDDERNWFAKREEARAARQSAERPYLPSSRPQPYDRYQLPRGRGYRGRNPPSEEEGEASEEEGGASDDATDFA